MTISTVNSVCPLFFRSCWAPSDRIAADITGEPRAVMQYGNYERDLVLRYGVVLEGWPKEVPFVNASELGSSLPTLQRLLDALEKGTCKFARLSKEDLQERKNKYEEDIRNGTIEEKNRSKRIDAGTTRKRKRPQDDANEGDTSDHEQASAPGESSTSSTPPTQKAPTQKASTQKKKHKTSGSKKSASSA